MLTQRYNGNSIAVFFALAEDSKPTDCPNGSKLYEIDTGKIYRFDKSNEIWVEYSIGEGGGGGGGTVTIPPATTSTLGGIIVGDGLSVTKSGILSAVADIALDPNSSNSISNSVVTNNLNLKLDILNAVGQKTEGVEMSNTKTSLVTGKVGSERFNDYSTNVSSGEYSHAEGLNNSAIGNYSHVEGCANVAAGNASHTEGYGNTASMYTSHAEGEMTTAAGISSHSEGVSTVAAGAHSHAEGATTIATGSNSHAEGDGTQAQGASSHAEGSATQAKGIDSHAGGDATIAWNNQYAIGRYNVENSDSSYAFIIGNGTVDTRSNAFAIDWNGNIYVGNSSVGVNVADIQVSLSNKQDALTFDSAPVSGSTNPVTSGGIYSSQQAQDSVITLATNAGAKNLLHVTAASTGGVVINSDGTITINGTYGFVSITLGSVTLKPGRYVLSSGVNMPNLFYLTVQVEEDGERYSCRQGVESILFDVPQEMTLNRVWFSTTNGASADNVTIRPMIRHAEIADDTFVPYAPTNRELYEMFNAISQSEYDALTTKTLPLYFVYEDDVATQNSNTASLMSASPLMTNSTGSDIGGVEETATESDFSFKSDEGADSTFDFFSEEES